MKRRKNEDRNGHCDISKQEQKRSRVSTTDNSAGHCDISKQEQKRSRVSTTDNSAGSCDISKQEQKRSRVSTTDNSPKPSLAVQYSCTHILGAKMDSYYNNPEFSDVKVQIGTQHYYTHGFLLSSWSDHLKNMISEAKTASSQYTPSSPCVSLLLQSPPKMEPYAMDQFIKFLYTGEIKLRNNKDAESVLAVAKLYEIRVLESQCENFWVHNLEEQDLKEAMYSLIKAEKLRIDRLLMKCKFILGLNFEHIPLDFWQKLSSDVVRELMGSSFLVAEDESVILDKLMLWMAGQDEEQKMLCFEKMISKIRFVHMSSKQLLEVDNNDYGPLINQLMANAIQAAFESRALIADSMKVRKQKNLAKKCIKSQISAKLVENIEGICPRIYWQFNEPGGQAAGDDQSEISLKLNGVKESVAVTYRDRGIWTKRNCLAVTKWDVRGRLSEKSDCDTEQTVSFELCPNYLHCASKYVAAIAIVPPDETVQVIPNVGCSMGKVKKVTRGSSTRKMEVIKLSLSSVLVKEETVKIRVAIYVWRDDKKGK